MTCYRCGNMVVGDGEARRCIKCNRLQVPPVRIAPKVKRDGAPKRPRQHPARSRAAARREPEAVPYTSAVSRAFSRAVDRCPSCGQWSFHWPGCSHEKKESQ